MEEKKTTKCIIMSRVSTTIQELDIQEEECMSLALADGYTKENMVLVPRLGESARKIGQIITVDTPRGPIEIELDRDGIWDMKKRIETDSSIDCVYIWEVSRLARRMDVLTPLLKYFADKKIQLIVKTNGIKFLNPDKSINTASKMTIEILGELAEQEMDLKIKRFKRTKKTYAEIGKYSGGKIPYGYSIDPQTKLYVINEDEAAIVREIFNLYEAGITQPKIAREFYRRGIVDINLSKVNNILTNLQYTGKEVKQGWSSYYRTYPVIITPEQYDKCRDIAEYNSTFAGKTKNIYYAHHLIECSCGRYWNAAPTKVTYQCAESHRSGNEYEVHGIGCNNRLTISINVLDSILWHIGQQAEVNYIAHAAAEDKQNFINRIAILEQKLSFIDTRLKEQDAKKSRAAESYIEGLIPRELRNEKFKEVEGTVKSILLEQTSYLSEKEHLQKLISDIETRYSLWEPTSITDEIIGLYNLQKEIAAISNDQERYDIIHRYIRKIHIENRTISYKFGIVGEKDTQARLITVFFYNGNIKYYFYLPFCGGKNVVMESPDDKCSSFKKLNVQYLNRFTDETKLKRNQKAKRQRKENQDTSFPESKFVIGYHGLMDFLGIKIKMAYKLGYQGCLEEAKVMMNKQNVAFNKKKILSILRKESHTQKWIKKILDNIPTGSKGIQD